MEADNNVLLRSVTRIRHGIHDPSRKKNKEYEKELSRDVAITITPPHCSAVVYQL